jgi:hypothetical protein
MAAVDVAVAPPHEVTLPAVISSDTPERAEKYFGMRAFGCGAELFPHLGLREARALRLLNTLMNKAVDCREWVCILQLGCVCVCEVCMYVCMHICVYVFVCVFPFDFCVCVFVFKCLCVCVFVCL